MTLIEWMSNYFRSSAPVRRPEAAHEPIQQRPPSLPAEWLTLYSYLDRRYATVVVLTFVQLESLLGSALPEAARTEKNWWTDTAPRLGRCSDAWTLARRTAMPNLPARTITFERLP